MHNRYVSRSLIYVRCLAQESLQVMPILLLEFYLLDLRGLLLKTVEALQLAPNHVDRQKHLAQAKHTPLT